MGKGVIDEESPEEDEEGVGGKLDALGEGARDKRGRDDGEHALEHGDEDEFGDVCAVVNVLGADAGEKEEGWVPADDAVLRGAEGERVAADDPLEADDAKGRHGMHHGAEDVFTADHAGVKEGEAGNHEHDEVADETSIQAVSTGVGNAGNRGRDLGDGGCRHGSGLSQAAGTVRAPIKARMVRSDNRALPRPRVWEWFITFPLLNHFPISARRGKVRGNQIKRYTTFRGVLS